MEFKPLSHISEDMLLERAEAGAWLRLPIGLPDFLVLKLQMNRSVALNCSMRLVDSPFCLCWPMSAALYFFAAVNSL